MARRGLTVVLVTLVLFAGLLSGQTTALERSVVGSAGGALTSASHGLRGTAGQAVQGSGASTSHLGYWGFWHGLMAREELPPDWLPGWTEVMPVPAGTPVKRGGWLAIDPSDQTIYAARGNKTYDFYSYDAPANMWTQLAPVPSGTEGKPPEKGCRGVCDGAGHLYMTKGYNTLGFHRYDIGANTWEQLPDVPEGPRGKRVKGGTDLVYVVDGNDTGWVYLLKGYRTEFYRYNTLAGRWDTLPNVPYVTKEKWDRGSWLVSDDAGDGYLYAHQAKYYNRATYEHYMHRFDLGTQAWDPTALTGMPLWGLHGGRIKKKKAKDGSAGAWYGGCIYALKGGNSQQFYRYTAATDTWVELDTMPTYTPTTGRRKRVKYGADIVHWGLGAFFALKGNKTVEFWRYVRRPGSDAAAMPVQKPERSGAVAGLAGLDRVGLEVVPNPVRSGRATLRYGLPQAGPASISVYDVSGRCVRRERRLLTERGVTALRVNGLAAGVYLLRLDAKEYTVTRKLVVQD